MSMINKEVSDFKVYAFHENDFKFTVMSVPCIVINDEKVFFGKKNVQQVLELIGV